MNLPFFSRLLLLAIRVYQRCISPYKGFRCAYRVHTGCASCSGLGYRAIRRYGVPGLAVLRRRLARCGEVYRHHHPPRPVNYQAGECDPGCALDCPSGGGKSSTLADCACSAADCLPCDWGGSRKRERGQQ